MARYLGPKCKLSRREGTDLQLQSGVRSIEEKCKINSFARILLCGHKYCDPCISRWLETKKTCPTCRYNITGS